MLSNSQSPHDNFLHCSREYQSPPKRGFTSSPYHANTGLSKSKFLEFDGDTINFVLCTKVWFESRERLGQMKKIVPDECGERRCVMMGKETKVVGIGIVCEGCEGKHKEEGNKLKSYHWRNLISSKFLSSSQKFQLHQKHKRIDNSSALFNESASCLCCSSCCKDIINNRNILSLVNTIFLDTNSIWSVFKIVVHTDNFSGKFSFFSDHDKWLV